MLCKWTPRYTRGRTDTNVRCSDLNFRVFRTSGEGIFCRFLPCLPCPRGVHKKWMKNKNTQLDVCKQFHIKLHTVQVYVPSKHYHIPGLPWIWYRVSDRSKQISCHAIRLTKHSCEICHISNLRRMRSGPWQPLVAHSSVIFIVKVILVCSEYG